MWLPLDPIWGWAPPQASAIVVAAVAGKDGYKNEGAGFRVRRPRC